MITTKKNLLWQIILVLKEHCFNGIQAYIGDNVDLIPDHHNKANITMKWVTWNFYFWAHINFRLTLYFSLLSVQ